MKPVNVLLKSFTGYIQLGMYLDAHEELESLPSEAKTNPMVLEARMMLFVELQKWDEGVLLGESLRKLWPGYLEFHFKTAYCLHELKRTKDAKEVLLAAPDPIRETALYYYTLACYDTELGNHDQARDQLRQCFVIDPKFREIALEEVSLEPLWQCIIV
jgi:tetratricopeptide (TPR) repeat protein